jgi:putative Holliday junction resolvase
VILGVDPGERRVGIAIADHETRFARPLEVIDSSTTDPVARIVELVRELEVDRIVIGRPIGLSGTDGPAVARQQTFVGSLKAACDVEIVESDERFTSVIADRALKDAGRSVKQARGVRDAVAAQVLLQSYLDADR